MDSKTLRKRIAQQDARALAQGQITESFQQTALFSRTGQKQVLTQFSLFQQMFFLRSGHMETLLLSGCMATRLLVFSRYRGPF